MPIVIAGGKKLPELDALRMAYQAIQEGAFGVNIGRNIFRFECSKGMAHAIGGVVLERYKPEEAYETVKADQSIRS